MGPKDFVCGDCGAPALEVVRVPPLYTAEWMPQDPYWITHCHGCGRLRRTVLPPGEFPERGWPENLQ
jgi:hypothetical protein